ncbi:DUF2339 domain-containing protein [Azohydromonas caseinilytica]|uniref:DUF2339 domain-containing protein n=1 Tax=Azohydromonas caseinilytica TaxID=2728836 RepID=A0A848FD68_9BURK|nr:DUF2339 domain-containing protein [Azohydromonas caseinilytica]NML15881.1 DUF2339 domain-containing protein [Azohydromonas caseinilytica]
MKTWLPLLLAVMVGVAAAESFGPLAVGLLAAFGIWLMRRQERLEAEVQRLRAALEAQRGTATATAPVPAQPQAAPDTVPAAAPQAPAQPLPGPLASPEDVVPEPVAAAPVLAAEVALSSPALEVPPSPAAAASTEADERALAVTSSLGSTLKAWLAGGNTIVRLAVLILFLGVAFLLRYAAERSLISVELRLAGVAAAAVALVLLGWRLRERRRGYGLSLQGAGIGVLYLTLFAALRLYELLPPVLAFALLVALGLFAALLALWQDALALAVLGFVGGFLAPVLTSTGQGSHVVLFSYYLLLNLGIAFIALHKAWKLLNLVGLLFTFGIGLGWGLRSWRPELLASTEPFLVAHVALYLWIAVQYGRRLTEAPAGAVSQRAAYVDAGLLFGMPLAAFGLQAGMVRHIPDALALSAAVMAGVYLLLGRWLWQRLGERLRLLTEGLLALGVVFLALVPPLALDDARWTSMAWALQGAGVAWVALRQRRGWALALGVALQLLGALSFWGQPPLRSTWAFANLTFLGVAVIALALLFSAWQSRREAPLATGWPAAGGRLALRATPGGLYRLHAGLLALGALHLVAGVLREAVDRPWTWPHELQSALMALAVLALLFEALHRPLRWPELSVAARPTLALGIPLWLWSLADAGFAPYRAWDWWWAGGTIAVLLWLGVTAWVLHGLDRDPAPGRWRRSLAAEHVAAGWVALAATALWAHAALGTLVPRHGAWTAAVVLAGPTALAWAGLEALQRRRWPQAAHARAWLRAWAAPWLGLMALWSVGVNAFAEGGMAPLPYVPLLNPIDLGHLLMLLYALRLQRALRPGAGAAAKAPPPRWALLIAAGVAFWWLDSFLVRTLHHWAGTPGWFEGALDSGLVQTTLTIAWTLCALAAMFLATRRVPPALARPVWLAGAVLLGLTVLKLMLVDLGQTSALQRIVSFLGVGLLMLVIGYVSPLPPAAPAVRREVSP